MIMNSRGFFANENKNKNKNGNLYHYMSSLQVLVDSHTI